MTTAFVLGGGGQLGAHEAGMLRALLERDVMPDMVVGTSVGAINGAAIATSPTVEMAGRLGDTWRAIENSDVFAGSLFGRLATLARTRTHLHENGALRATLTEALEIALIEDLPVRFQCVAASIEAAAEHWFSSGPLVEAVMASAAVPGLLPPVEIDGEHFVDGGIVNSIPVDRALSLGATRIFVMHVGRVDRPLAPPRWPWEVALVAFEIARRHRFVGDLAAIPDSVEVHVMPTGQPEPPRYNDLSALRYRVTPDVGEGIERAYRASRAYLEARGVR
jgi:NTE family protein